MSACGHGCLLFHVPVHAKLWAHSMRYNISMYVLTVAWLPALEPKFLNVNPKFNCNLNPKLMRRAGRFASPGTPVLKCQSLAQTVISTISSHARAGLFASPGVQTAISTLSSHARAGLFASPGTPIIVKCKPQVPTLIATLSSCARAGLFAGQLRQPQVQVLNKGQSGFLSLSLHAFIWIGSRYKTRLGAKCLAFVGSMAKASHSKNPKIPLCLHQPLLLGQVPIFNCNDTIWERFAIIWETCLLLAAPKQPGQRQSPD